MENFSLEDFQNLVWLLIILTLWAIPWKAMALWRSARRGQVGWFIFFVLINTVGIVEIIYLKFSGGLKAEGIKETWSFLKSKLKSRQRSHSENKTFKVKQAEPKQESASEDLNARKILMEERKGRGKS